MPGLHKNSSRKRCNSCNKIHNRKKAAAHYQRCIEDGRIHKYREVAKNRNAEKAKQQTYRLLRAARNRARTKGVEFDLTEDDIYVPEFCPVFKTPFEKGTERVASIDAIDPARGYTKDNVQVLSMKANAMKNNATPEELHQFAKWVLTSVVKAPNVPEV